MAKDKNNKIEGDNPMADSLNESQKQKTNQESSRTELIKKIVKENRDVLERLSKI